MIGKVCICVSARYGQFQDMSLRYVKDFTIQIFCSESRNSIGHSAVFSIQGVTATVILFDFTPLASGSNIYRTNL
jgi:hypothetical protein